MSQAAPTMRGFFKDQTVREHKLTKDTRRRILQFARPYRGQARGLRRPDRARGGRRRRHAAAVQEPHRQRHHRRQHRGRASAIAAAVAGLAILSAGLSVADRWVSSQVGEGLILDLRTAVFDHVQRMPLAFFSRAKTGALVQRLNGDVLGAQQAFTSTLQNVVSNALTIVFVLAAMFSMSWQLTLLSLVLLPAFVLPARWFGKKIAKVTRESYELNADAAQIMNERFNVAGAHLVKIFGDPERESAAYAAQVGRVRDIGVTRALYSTWFRVGLTTLASVAVATVYGIGGVMAINGELTVGVVVALTAYLGRLYGPLTVDVERPGRRHDRARQLRARARGARPGADGRREAGRDDLDDGGQAARRVRHARPRRLPLPERRRGLAGLPRVRRDPDPRGARRHAHATSASRSRRATWSRSSATRAPARRRCRSWSRACTTRRRGSVTIAGTDLRDVTQASLRATVGVVSQEAHLFHDTIAENLRYARPEATDEDIDTALRQAHIADLVDSLPDGIQTVVGDRGYRLSGGERQRLAIARMLLKAPDVVILDEATAHLDSESEAAVQAALDEALSGRTSIVIAHRLSTVRQADSIVVLETGPRHRPGHARRAARARRRLRGAVPDAVRHRADGRAGTVAA